jgi:hypothetical protein
MAKRKSKGVSRPKKTTSKAIGRGGQRALVNIATGSQGMMGY